MDSQQNKQEDKGKWGTEQWQKSKTEGGSFYVYTHWYGTDFPEIARDAIMAAKSRWDDLTYANRIIVDQRTKDGRDQETGFGLMLQPNAEDEHNGNSPSVIIDMVKQESLS
jgi:hypothetical protein